MRQVFTRITVAGAACLLLAGCATMATHGMMRSSKDFDMVFRACVDTAKVFDRGFMRPGWKIASADPQTGIIKAHAGQAVYGVLPTMVLRVKQGSPVNVEAVFEYQYVGSDPGSTTGGLTPTFKKFANALRKRVPDARVVFVKDVPEGSEFVGN